MPDVPEKDILDYTTFDCTSQRRSWQSPIIYLADPSVLTGDFLYYDPGCLVVSPSAVERVRPFFKRAGELLPLWFDGEEYTLLNVTECVDALDDSKTEWLRAGDNNHKVEICRYAFNPNKFTDSSIFKIPETCSGSALTWEKDGDPKTEFKAFVEENGLTGLLFRELWNSEQG